MRTLHSWRRRNKSASPLSQQTIFPQWAHAGPEPASCSWQVKKGHYGRTSMCKCHRYSICQPIILSLASHSAVQIHKILTRAVAMAAAPSSSSSPDTILVNAVPYMFQPPFLPLVSAFSRCIQKHLQAQFLQELLEKVSVFLASDVLCYLNSRLLPALGCFTASVETPRLVWLLCGPPDITRGC